MTLTWQNGRQQLATLTKGGATSSYSYDINGNRTKKVANGVTTEYYYSGEQYTGMHTSDGKDVGAILDASGSLYGIYYDDSTIGTDVGQTYYFVYNGQGDVIGLYNHGGKLIATYAYDAWGRCIEAKAVTADDDGHAVTDPDHIAFINPFRYRGYMYDAESGLYYLGSRYYDPETGRFINADSVMGVNQDMASYNLFVYCGNNPICRADSSGQAWWSVVVAAVAVVAVCAMVVVAAPVLAPVVGVAASSLAVGAANTALVAGITAISASVIAAVEEPLVPSAPNPNSNNLNKQLGDIAGAFGLYECTDAAMALKKYLEKNKKDYSVITIQYPSVPGFVVSVSHNDMLISTNGFHIGICVDGIVYCNVHPLGLPKQQWIDDFDGLGPKMVNEV